MARRLDVKFVDTDLVIEQQIGESILSFFRREGEQVFRNIEQEVISALAEFDGVLATGGGVVLREANRRVLRANGAVIYLRSSPDELFRRLRHDTARPLLQGNSDPRAKLRVLHRERDSLYRSTAHFVIETGRPTVQALVGMILMQLELAGCVDPMRVPSPVERHR